jgi:hypothetical protein
MLRVHNSTRAREMGTAERGRIMRLVLGATKSISVLVLLSVMGCGADAGPNVAEETGTATQEVVTALPKRGGNGGTAWSTNYATYYRDFQARTGYYVDALEFTYVIPGYDGLIGTGFYGGAGGTLSRKVYCTEGRIVGYFGTAGDYLNSFNVICEQYYQHTMPPYDRWKAYTYSGSDSQAPLGRSADTAFYDECPRGQVIKSFVIWSGAWIDAIQGFCGPK